MQLTPGRSPIRYSQFDYPAAGLHITHSRLTQTDFSEFEVPRGYTFLSICCSLPPHFQNGYRVDRTSMIVYPGGRRYQAAYAAGWESFDILLENDLIAKQPRLEGELQSLETGADLIVSPRCGSAVGSLTELLIDLFAGAFDIGSAGSRQNAAEAVATVIARLPSVLQEEFPRGA